MIRKDKMIEINHLSEIQPGDILFFFVRNTITGQIVRLVQQFHFHSRKYADVVHAAICLDKEKNGMPIIGHLTPSGFKIETLLNKFQRQGTHECIVMRLAEIEELDHYRCQLIEVMEKSKQAHVKYDTVASFFSIFHIDTKHARPFYLNKSICSSIIAKCLTNAGIPGFEDSRINILPSELYKACKKNNLFLKLFFSGKNVLKPACN